MKTLFILLLLAAIAGAFGWRYYQRSQNPTLGDRAAAIAEHSKEMAINAKDAAMAKFEEWNLTPENIKSELSKTGQIVGSRATVVGEKTEDARIITLIKSRYLVEKNLSSFSISVGCKEGEVSLTSVNEPNQIAQAVALALQTNGVRSVVSRLQVKA